MARIAVEDGFTAIVATPHFGTLRPGRQRDDVERRVAEFQAALDSEAIPLRVFPGAELMLTREASKLADAGELVPLAGSRYLLVEIPFTHYPDYTDEMLFQLQTRGFLPIFAHPERQLNIQRKPEIMEALAARGVLSQVTALSINGGNGGTARASAERLNRLGATHVLSTDAHHPTGARVPKAKLAAGKLALTVGEARAQAMASSLPAAIVEDREYRLPGVAPQQAELPSVSWWRRLVPGGSR